MKYLRIIACCLALLLSNPCFADVRIRLLFDGKPFAAEATPEFSCRSDSTQQWFDCALTPTGQPGEYTRRDLAPGSYVILLNAEGNLSNPKNQPGDWHADYRFKIVSGNDIVDVPMTRLLHLAKPQSNDGPLPGSLGESCANKPLFVPAGHPWTREMTIPFEWDSVVKDATYKISVVRRHCETFQDLGVFRQFETTQTSFPLTLPPNAEDEYYAFFISAFKDGRFIGDFLTYDAGMQSWSYGFKIGPVVTPASYYVAAGSIVFALVALWFALGRLGLGIVPRVLVQSVPILGLILGPSVIPDARTLPPYKYFDVPPVYLANVAPPKAVQETQRNYAYSWDDEVPKPVWWESVTAERSINSYGELLLWWQNQDSSDKAQKQFFKAIFEAIKQHPEDEQLTVTGMSFLFYLCDDPKVLAQVGRVAIEHHLHHIQRTDNCAECSPADTIAQIASSYAYVLARLQEPEKAITMLQSVLDAREKDMSRYQVADLHITAINILYGAGQVQKAREKLDYALSAFRNTNRADRLMELDRLISESGKTKAAAVSVDAKRESAREHLDIAEQFLEQSGTADKSDPQFQSAIEHVKTAVASGLNYEQTARANLLIALYASDNLTADEHFKLGKSLIEANHYDSAGSTQKGMEAGIRQMKEAIRLNCSDLKRANIILANAYDQMPERPSENSDADKTRVAERNEVLRRLYRLYPDDLEILDMYAVRSTDQKEKFAVYSHMKELNPNLPAPHYMLGLFLIKDGKVGTGIHEIKTWLGLERDPSNVRAYSVVAVEYLTARGCVVPKGDTWMSRFLDIEMAMSAGEADVREQGLSDFREAKQEFLAALNDARCPEAKPEKVK